MILVQKIGEGEVLVLVSIFSLHKDFKIITTIVLSWFNVVSNRLQSLSQKPYILSHMSWESSC